ncbi:MAG: TrkA family potassium uptake protein [Candidatus Thermoplasmatota archaeon]|nr:TrkA family potassium uptake protein [Candidatus Thermoplasmatota archaeon]
MYVVIIGGGRVGKDLAKLLLPEGHDVVLMEKDEALAEQLSKEFDALVIEGDGTELDYLKDAGLNRADAVIAVTGDDKSNLIMCQLAQKIFQVPKVIGRVNDPKNEGVFMQLGVEETVSTTRASAMQIKNKIGEAKTILTVGEKEAQLMEFKVTQESPIAHKKIKSAGLPKGVIIVDIMRDENSVIPDGNTQIQPEDIVTVLARTSTVKQVKKLFEKKKRFGIL